MINITTVQQLLQAFIKADDPDEMNDVCREIFKIFGLTEEEACNGRFETLYGKGWKIVGFQIDQVKFTLKD